MRRGWVTLVGLGAVCASVATGAERIRRRRRRIDWTPPHGAEHHGTLFARTLGETGPPIVLLHGLGASNRYWGAAFDELAEVGRLVVPDLLGFGASPRPPAGYGPHEHADAVAACLRELGADDRPALVGGHSTGCLVALHLAARHPNLVGGIVAFAPPLYDDREEGLRHVARLGLMARGFVLDTPLAFRTCRWVCDHRETAARLAAIVRPDLPAPIARDGVQHTWPSYSETLDRLVLRSDSVTLVRALRLPIRFVTGERDPVPDRAVLAELGAGRENVTVEVWPDADHELVLTRPRACVEVMRGALLSLA